MVTRLINLLNVKTLFHTLDIFQKKQIEMNLFLKIIKKILFKNLKVYQKIQIVNLLILRKMIQLYSVKRQFLRKKI